MPLLRKLGLHCHFDLVLSGDSLERKKPDPLPLVEAAARFDLDTSDCVMVGDTITDVTAARGAGMPVICVTYGYNEGMDVRQFGADAVVDSLYDILALLILDH